MRNGKKEEESKRSQTEVADEGNKENKEKQNNTEYQNTGGDQENKEDEELQTLMEIFKNLTAYPPKEVDEEHMEFFLTEPIPQGVTLMVNITRKKTGLEKIYPKYFCTVHESNAFLMAARKRPHNVSANYIITMSKDNFEKESKQTIGKLRSNFMGTEFNIYDNGKNPNDSKNLNEIRCQYASVVYESNFLGLKGPRTMKVLIPDLEYDEIPMIKPLNNDSGIIERYNNNNVNYNTKCSISCFVNKKPAYSEQHKSFFLNFSGRIKQGSVKNFQIIKENDPDYLYIQFGRIDDNTFALDFQYPFSPLQAFSVALTSLERKFACE